MMDVDIYGYHLHALRKMPGVVQVVASNRALPDAVGSSAWEIAIQHGTDAVIIMDTDPLTALSKAEQWVYEAVNLAKAREPS